MSIALARTATSGCINPVLMFYAYVDGFLANVSSLEFVVFDISSPSRRRTPVQVFPGSGREAVDLAACPAGDNLGTGRYVATYTVDAAENLGDHRIVWYVTRAVGDTEETFEQEFGVVPTNEVVIPGSYCTITDMRDEGLEDCEGDDRRLIKAITRSSKFIDRVTGQFFSPRYQTQKLNGRGSPYIFCSPPIVAMETVSVDTFPFETDPTFLFSASSLRVYNRHLTAENMQPDDRHNPKIELFRGAASIHPGDIAYAWTDVGQLIFPKGQQNVTLTGVFGYTEYDGSTGGAIPEDIRTACALLTMRNLVPYSDPDRAVGQQDFRISQEKTRQQSISYASPGGSAQTMMYGVVATGDPEIDAILAAYMRPPAMGGV